MLCGGTIMVISFQLCQGDTPTIVDQSYCMTLCNSGARLLTCVCRIADLFVLGVARTICLHVVHTVCVASQGFITLDVLEGLWAPPGALSDMQAPFSSQDSVVVVVVVAACMHAPISCFRRRVLHFRSRAIRGAG
jgi:hypothetical protein